MAFDVKNFVDRTFARDINELKEKAYEHATTLQGCFPELKRDRVTHADCEALKKFMTEALVVFFERNLEDRSRVI